MIDFSEGYSREFIRIMNVVIDEIFSHFMEVGDNLDYEEIYSTVFPKKKVLLTRGLFFVFAYTY